MPAVQRGVSLIEALVAMAIMAFGMLGVLGMQTTLRSNGDIAKQRSEAVRIAQATMEGHRAFSVLDAAPGFTSYAAIATASEVAAVQDNANTAFKQTETVVPFPTGAADAYYLAAYKSVVVDLNWSDRNNTLQTVRINSIIAAVAPEITAALAAPAVGSSMQNPGGRNVAVPVGAVNLGDGSSRFSPPGAPDGVNWIFSNTTAVIQRICLNLVCSAFNGRLLTGYVRFATGSVQPTSANAENPPDALAQPGVGVSVTLTEPSASPVTCFQDTTLDASLVAYFCALPIDSGSGWWSGRSMVTGLALAAGISDPTASLFRVCRYTPSRWNTATPLVKNEDHPLDYARVQAPLSNQNFLVIRAGSSAVAGDGGVPFTCPDDTNVLGKTFDHQPSI